MRYLIAVAVLGLAGSAMAETWTVDDDGPADFDNIQAAVDAASDGDEIVVEPGTYTGTGEDVVRIIAKDIWLHSTKGPDATIIDGEVVRQAMRTINSGSTISGFTLSRGYGGDGGALICKGGAVTLDNCIIRDSVADYGAGVYFINSDAVLIGCVVTGNSGNYGGGIVCINSSPSLTDCTIWNNSATNNGGGFWLGDSYATLSGCSVSSNVAGSFGGGIYSSSNSNPLLSSSTVCGNDPTQIWGDWIDGGGNTIADVCGPPTGACCIDGACSIQTNFDCDAMGGNYYGDDIDCGSIDCPDPTGACCISEGCSIMTNADCDAIDGYYFGDASECSDGSCHVWTVDDDGPADFDNIQAAVDAASDGDEIVVEAGTYTGTVDLGVKEVTLRSSEGSDVTIIDGLGSVACLECRGSELQRVDGFTLRNGFRFDLGAGGVNFYGGAANVANCLIVGNSGHAGGVWAYQWSGVLIECSIVNNTGNGCGGGISCVDSNPTLPTLLNCSVATNLSVAGCGGGIYCYESNPAVQLLGTEICGNIPNQIDGQWINLGGNSIGAVCNGESNGACCLTVECSIQTVWDCIDMGGDYQGDGVVCADGIFCHVWTVDDDGPADFDNIQAAVDAANDGDKIVVEAGTYTGTDNQVVDMLGKTITLRSSQGADVTIIDGEGARRVLQCTSGEDADTVIQGFTITGGWSATDGGGIYCESNSTPTITNCTISGNIADYGGGIYCSQSDPSLSSCTISDNTATYSDGDGGGIYCTDSSPTINGCTISNNTAVNYGGGISCQNDSNPTLTECTISGNTAANFGGGIYCSYDSNPMLSACTISNNTALYNAGGGIFCYYSNPTLTECTISGNTAAIYGAGIYCSQSDPTITNCTISGNIANYGGGIYCRYSSPTLTNCEISGNTAHLGGGILCQNSNPTLTNCTLSGNTANYYGGGIYCSQSDPTITNCEISNNTADSAGGGIYCYSNNSNPTLAHTTVCGNAPDQIDGDWIDNGGNVIADECPSECIGDLDGSGEVGVDDLLAVLAAYQQNADGDCDDDGDTDVDDLLLLISAWGPCP